MKLFLASLASVTLDLVLPLLPNEPKNLKVAFIPTAGDLYGEDNIPWMNGDHVKLVSMGFLVTDYDIKGKNVETLRQDLAQFQIIFVAGGNTYYLLNEVKKSGFDIVIKEQLEKGIVYIGSSAGSCIMCSTIDHVRLIEHPEAVPELTNFNGLGLVKELLVPHYGKEKYLDRFKQITADWGDKVTPLTDNQVLVVNGDKITLATI